MNTNSSDDNLVLYKNNDKIFEALADDVIQIIEKNNQKKKETLLIFPVGPVGQYPYIVEKVNNLGLSLNDTWILNMDEYLNDDLKLMDPENDLSFKRNMDEAFYDLLDKELTVPVEQRIFPHPENTGKIQELIEQLGGVDLVVGGIGLNGHVAFNEPMYDISNEDYLNTPTRIVRISEATRATNSINALNGKFRDFPKYGVTIGLKEVYEAKSIRLGVFRDWHQGVLEDFIGHEPSGAFPVSLLKTHRDFKLYAPEVLIDSK